MDPLSLLVGALLVVAGCLTERATRRAYVAPATGEYVCACGHSLAFHDLDPDDSQCNALDLVEDDQCRCLRYVGPIPPPELDPADVLRALGSDRPTEEPR